MEIVAAGEVWPVPILIGLLGETPHLESGWAVCLGRYSLTLRGWAL